MSIYFKLHPGSRPPRRLALLALLPLAILGSTVSAQTALDAAPSSLSARQTQAQPPAFLSAFEGYKPYTDDAAPEWKMANDEVGKVGGWRAYAREAQGEQTSGSPSAQPQPQPQPAPAATAAPATPNVQPVPHAGHSGHEIP